MIGSLARPLLILIMASMLTGCPRLYLSFEKHGGTFLKSPEGPEFAHLEDHAWDAEENALLYFYRPLTDWSAEEIDAPTLYIDDERYVNLRGGGYTWLEVAAGTRQITLRRPLGVVLGFEGFGGFNLSKPLDTTFEAEAGRIYYFRYSEVDPPKVLNPALEPNDALAQGDMQLVAWELAFPEIIEMRLMESHAPFSKSDAARSIVVENRMGEFERREDELLEARELEMEELEAAGYWRSNQWWCLYLCGGGPTQSLKADQELAALEERREDYEYQVALNENNKPESDDEGSWWWPF